MDSEEDAILRLRSRAIPTMPTFPDLKSSLDGELSPGKGQQSSEDNHITSNGEKISTPSLVGPAERAVTSGTVNLLTQQLKNHRFSKFPLLGQKYD